MSKYITLNGAVSEDEEKALDVLVNFHNKKLVNPMCFYCENNLATTMKFGQIICDNCISKGKEIRTSAPIHLMDEHEKAIHLRIGIYMSEVGRKAKGDKPNE